MSAADAQAAPREYSLFVQAAGSKEVRAPHMLLAAMQT